MATIHKIGRRKTAVARVYVSEGTGVITVNKKEFATLIDQVDFIVANNSPSPPRCKRGGLGTRKTYQSYFTHQFFR